MGIAFLLLGVFLLVINPPWIRGNLDPMSAIQTGMGLIVGFCLTQYIGLATVTRKTQREVVIAATGETKAELKKLDGAIAAFLEDQSSDRAWQAVTGQVKVLGISILTIEALIRECGMDAAQCGLKDVRVAFDALRPTLGERQFQKPAITDQRMALLYRNLSLLALRLVSA